MSTPTHQHFCARCYGVGHGQGRRNGWWNCNKRPCAKPESAPCKYHEELDAARETRHD